MQLVLVFLNFSRVSEVTLGLFVGFLCYVVGTKLGRVLLLRMREMILLLRMREMMWMFCRCGCDRKLCSSCLSFSMK